MVKTIDFVDNRDIVNTIVGELARTVNRDLSIRDKMGNKAEWGDDYLTGFDVCPRVLGLFNGTPVANFSQGRITAYDADLVDALQVIADKYLGKSVEVSQEEYGWWKYDPSEDDLGA